MKTAMAQALSVVAPSGQWIVEGRKTLEIRSWLPDQWPLKDLLIVENKHFLNNTGDQEMGTAIAWVDLESIHAWQQHEVEQACSAQWQTGYFAWVLVNLRPIEKPFAVLAKRKIYFIGIDHA